MGRAHPHDRARRLALQRDLRFRPGFTRHPKLLDAGPLALALYVAAIDFSASHLTDGILTEAQLSTLLDLRGVHHELPDLLPGMTTPVAADELIRRLVNTKLLDQLPDGRFAIHDFADHQETAAEVAARRTRDAQRKRQARQRGKPPDASARTPRGRRADPPICATPHSGSSDREISDSVSDQTVRAVIHESLNRDRLEPLRRLAEEVRGVDATTVSKWASAAGSLPLEWAAAEAREWLTKKKRVELVHNEAGYITRALRQMRAERVA